MSSLKTNRMVVSYTSRISRKIDAACLAVMLMMAFLFGLFAPLASTVAATATWKASEAVRSHQNVGLRPKAAMTFEIKFKNTGNQTWRNSGTNFVALATVEPEKRKSLFQHSYWNEEFYRPARLLEAVVKPGETGTFRFALQAPDKEGAYNETFQAVAKNLAWIEGTKFTIPITVTKTVETTPAPTPSTGTTTAPAVKTLTVDYPVRDAQYAAQWPAGQVIEINATPGQQILQTIEVKNIGQRIWQNKGTRYISLYTVRANYHESAMFSNGPGWINKTQVRLATTTVMPNQTGTITLMLQAPKAAGTYKESLRLAVEEYSWIKDGEVQIVLKVADAAAPAPTPSTTNPGTGTQPTTPTSPTTTIYKDTTYEALYLISSHRELKLEPGNRVTFQVGFKNTGTKTWSKNNSRYVSLYTIEPNYRVSRFASLASGTSGWLSASQVAMTQDEVLPGQIGYFKFDIIAPSTPGTYVEKFRLAVEDLTWVKGGELELPIDVEGRTGTLPNIDVTTPGVPTALGPMMRVGLYASTAPFTMTADSPFEVRSGNGELLVSLPARSPVTVSYDTGNGQYRVSSLGLERTQSDYVVLKSLDVNTIMEITSLSRPLPWNPAVNENTFRGSLEIRYSPKTSQTWAINVLPMEHYLRGIAETSSESAVEFLKVMSVAARTYATYHYQRQTKHADKFFYVDSELDQVYKGYALEKRHPRLTEAVDATTGMVVTYTDPATGLTKIAITPYYSRSDGRTRSWSEVWGGDVPWAKSVPVPQDVGKTLLGHGVGMSARGALYMIEEDGMTYDQVLKYFFTGIQIEDWY